MPFVRVTSDLALRDTDELGRVIAALILFWPFTVDFDQLRIVDITSKRSFNRFQIGFMPVCRELDAVCQPGS